jgi:hypothetical protein
MTIQERRTFLDASSFFPISSCQLFLEVSCSRVLNGDGSKMVLDAVFWSPREGFQEQRKETSPNGSKSGDQVGTVVNNENGS